MYGSAKESSGSTPSESSHGESHGYGSSHGSSHSHGSSDTCCTPLVIQLSWEYDGGFFDSEIFTRNDDDCYFGSEGFGVGYGDGKWTASVDGISVNENLHGELVTEDECDPSGSYTEGINNVGVSNISVTVVLW